MQEDKGAFLVRKNILPERRNLLSGLLLLVKLVFCKIRAKIREIRLCTGKKGIPRADLADLIRKNADIIELITIENLCSRLGININSHEVIIKYPPKLFDKQPLLMFYSEITVLSMLAKGMNAKNIFEIGTFEGNTSANIAYNVNDDAAIYTLDFSLYRLCANADAAVKYVESDARARSIVKILEGDSLEFDFSPFYNRMDIVYIDGGKTYKCVLSDSENAYRCVKNGGLIIWHDFLAFGKYHSVVASVAFDLCRKYHLKLSLIDGTRMVIAKKNYEDKP